LAAHPNWIHRRHTPFELPIQFVLVRRDGSSALTLPWLSLARAAQDDAFGEREGAEEQRGVEGVAGEGVPEEGMPAR